jgi:hypothetical protein
MEEDKEAEALLSRLWKYFNSNKIKSIIVLLIVAFLICCLMWYLEDDVEYNNDDNQQYAALQDFPEQGITPVLRTNWLSDNFTLNPSLSYKYPADWQKSSASTDLSEYVYLRSPKDANGYYFCFDMTEYDIKATNNLSMNAEVVAVDPTFTADGIFKPLNALNYSPLDGRGGYHLTIIDDTSVKPGENVSFEESITNPNGRRLSVLGQYNCDDLDVNNFSLSQYQNGLLYEAGIEIGASISY